MHNAMVGLAIFSSHTSQPVMLQKIGIITVDNYIARVSLLFTNVEYEK